MSLQANPANAAVTIPLIGLGGPDPNQIAELVFATVVLVFIIGFHGWCLNRVSRSFASRFALYTPRTARWRVNGLTSITIATLVVIHLIETMLWTLPLYQLGVIPGFRNAYYFVFEAYTTLGEGNVALPQDWQLVGPVIAISGLFTFGWTGSVLVYVMNEIGKLHSLRSRIAARAGASRLGQEPDPAEGKESKCGACQNREMLNFIDVI